MKISEKVFIYPSKVLTERKDYDTIRIFYIHNQSCNLYLGLILLFFIWNFSFTDLNIFYNF